MNFDTYFRFTSYGVVACGALALLASEGIGFVVAVILALTLIISWQLEGSRWQISERLGLVLIIFSLPLFYLDWQYQIATLARERAGAATLAHLILGLSVIKLWQKKADRDFVFLYLISFFEILLAAGLSISPLFLGVLILYLFFSACTIIAFEIRKAERSVKILNINFAPPNKENGQDKSGKSLQRLILRMPFAALGILILITVVAIPLFFVMPRVGGAGMGSGGGLSGFVGFSNKVQLGAIGKLQQNNEVVMRIRVEEPEAERNQSLRWRGVALDKFENNSWENSAANPKTLLTKSENGFFQFGTHQKTDILTVQTIYLEPINNETLFAADRAIAVQGNFPNLYWNDENALSLPYSSTERMTYKVFSNTSKPGETVLRSDNAPYTLQDKKRYLQKPANIDARIEILTRQIIEKTGTKNRYDAARAIESYLQNEYGYTLEQKAGGSGDSIAKFLFDVREGHCEYFSSAMVLMLRTQNIAARVVNGFQTGVYNDAADAYIVTQREAHSWVEVYFPASDSWVTFDPTPAVGRNLSQQDSVANPIAARFNKYAEAMQMLWLQYVVGYDNQEQRSLARNLRGSLMQSQERLTSFWTTWKIYFSEWWNEVRGRNGAQASADVIGKTVLWLGLIIITVFGGWILFMSLRSLQFWRKFNFWKKAESARIIEFYERMNKVLVKRGLIRQPSQTQLEFAAALAMPEVNSITEAYNRVRFGKHTMSKNEFAEIELWLRKLEEN